MAFIGIDIGGTSAKLAFVEEGRVVWTAQSPRYHRPTAAELIAALHGALDGRRLKVDGAGLCVPGRMDRQRRCILYSVNIPGLMELGLDELVRQGLGADVPPPALVSDVIAAGYDLWQTRRLEGRLMALALGTGVGAAVLDEGVPLVVESESSGHVGQMDVSLPDEPVIGPDGGAGSLEGYLGSAALLRRYGPDLERAIAAWRGDEVPLRALARAIRICHAIYRPRHICLLGGIGIHLGHVLEPLRALISTDLTSVADPGWTLTTGQSDFHSACGAARWAERSR